MYLSFPGLIRDESGEQAVQKNLNRGRKAMLHMFQQRESNMEDWLENVRVLLKSQAEDAEAIGD